MPSRPQRGKRIDYSILHSTGGRVPANQQIESSELRVPSTDDQLELSIKLDKLSLDEMSLSSELCMETNIIIEEIRDIMDENPIHADYVDDFQSVIDKLGDLRKKLRRKEQLIKAEVSDHPLLETIASIFDDVKTYIKTSKDCKMKHNHAQNRLSNDNAALKDRSTFFAIEDLRYKITELQKEFDKQLDDLSDAELIESTKSQRSMKLFYKFPFKKQKCSKM